MRRFEQEPPRREPASTRAAEPLPAEAAVLGLQHAAGNRAVSALLARQPTPADSGAKPTKERAATSTLGLGDAIGVIPLDSMSLGQADHEGNIHEIHVSFVINPAVPAIQKAMLEGKPIPEGFYSSTSMKLPLKEIVIASLTFSDDPEGGQIVSMTVNFTAMEFEPVR